jgi:hypothetical protein
MITCRTAGLLQILAQPELALEYDDVPPAADATFETNGGPPPADLLLSARAG